MTTPAPESERAKNACKHCNRELMNNGGEIVHAHNGLIFCDLPHLPYATPNDSKPAPASCSEVVERLAECVINPARGYSFDRTRAESILHEWRERRVQELEECLRDELMQAKACVSQMRTMPTNSDIGKEAVLKSAAQRIKYMEEVLKGGGSHGE